jgi:hypothetical protein
MLDKIPGLTLSTANVGGSPLALRKIADGHGDLRAAACEGKGCLKAQAGVRAGDQGQSAGQVGEVCGGPGHADSLLAIHPRGK